jgi:hypothetical protein
MAQKRNAIVCIGLSSQNDNTDQSADGYFLSLTLSGRKSRPIAPVVTP